MDSSQAEALVWGHIYIYIYLIWPVRALTETVKARASSSYRACPIRKWGNIPIWASCWEKRGGIPFFSCLQNWGMPSMSLRIWARSRNTFSFVHGFFFLLWYSVSTLGQSFFSGGGLTIGLRLGTFFTFQVSSSPVAILIKNKGWMGRVSTTTSSNRANIDYFGYVVV